LADGVFGINIDVIIIGIIIMIINATAIFASLGLMLYGVETPNFAYYSPEYFIPLNH
jgi:hypothetical protein